MAMSTEPTEPIEPTEPTEPTEPPRRHLQLATGPAAFTEEGAGTPILLVQA